MVLLQSAAIFSVELRAVADFSGVFSFVFLFAYLVLSPYEFLALLSSDYSVADSHPCSTILL